MTSPINAAFMKLASRAETNSREDLVETFVDVGPLFTVLSNRDHQLIYGRRGTGKTHALNYLASSVDNEGDMAVEVDLRRLGSTGGFYAGTGLPLAERAARIFIDLMEALHDDVMTFAFDHIEDIDVAELTKPLDRFREAVSQYTIEGVIEEESREGQRRRDHNRSELGTTVDRGGPAATAGFAGETEREDTLLRTERRSGDLRHRVHFALVRSTLQDLVNFLAPRRIWLLLDEWSEMPAELQPVFADLLKRVVFPVRNLTVKIAAIEHRSRFRTTTADGQVVGLETGADVAVSLSLDDYMVFDNDADRAKDFFRQLLFKHVLAVTEEENQPASPHELVRVGFTQRNAFGEFVKAAEGVPRDGLAILFQAAQMAIDDAISVPHVRGAAKVAYQRRKERAVVGREEAHRLLRWIIDEVIGHRTARAFMLRSDHRHELIDFLFDARVLHIVKQGVSGRDEPGVRYNVYSIDYGCYVDLINTAQAPRGLFQVEDEGGEASYVDVPSTDYRSIRRAILDINAFEETLQR